MADDEPAPIPAPAPELPEPSFPERKGCQAGSGGAPWWVVAASVQGRGHATTGTGREDAVGVAGGGLSERLDAAGWFAIAVADGVGSAPLAAVGANLAVDTVLALIAERAAGAIGDPGPLLNDAAWQALLALDREAQRRARPLRDLATTLLVAIGVVRPGAPTRLAAFQAGNGLLARTSSAGALEAILDPGDEDEDGAIHDLTSSHVRTTWDARRMVQIDLDPPPWAILAMSDGLHHDLLPIALGGPILARALADLAAPANDPTAPERLLELISYEKRGSSDDRTLACAFSRGA